jgi:carbon monoxide dehydrogenase subunit G
LGGVSRTVRQSGKTQRVKFEGKISIQAPAAEVWECLLDPNCLAECTPGVSEMVQVDSRTFRGVMSASIGPLSGKFRFQSSIVENRPPRQLVVDLSGTDSVTGSTISAKTDIDLVSDAARSTDIIYRCSVEITGRLAILGEMVLRTTAMLVLEEFSRRLRQRLEMTAPELSDG